jgi:hypothetical protein
MKICFRLLISGPDKSRQQDLWFNKDLVTQGVGQGPADSPLASICCGTGLLCALAGENAITQQVGDDIDGQHSRDSFMLASLGLWRRP